MHGTSRLGNPSFCVEVVRINQHTDHPPCSYRRPLAPFFSSRSYINVYTYRLEEVLSTRRYLAGDRVTLSDVRVFPSLVRFDEVYNVYFKCNRKRVADYPNILNYCRDLYQNFPEGFASTTEMDHIKVREQCHASKEYYSAPAFR